jgi:hypothetical protein
MPLEGTGGGRRVEETVRHESRLKRTLLVSLQLASNRMPFCFGMVVDLLELCANSCTVTTTPTIVECTMTAD